ncbi:MAG: hypothetical protein KY455_07485 [Euryarchaeota archaeon]|nr:hypothetical protein [Euryarchaeota archaeon]
MRPAVNPVFVACALSIVLLSGCLGDDPTPAGAPATTEGPVLSPAVYEFKDRFLAAGAEEPKVFPFDVPENATEVEGLLVWTTTAAVLDFRLLDPAGEEAADGWGESKSHRYVTTTASVTPGTWKAEVTISRGVDVGFALQVTARIAEPYGAIEETFTIPARNPARDLPGDLRGTVYPILDRDYAEVNLNMVPGDGFAYTWNADGEVYFNVHYHKEGATERPIEKRTDQDEGNFTADASEVYALLWRNEGSEPVTVTLKMDGVYRLHSMTRETPPS